MDCSVCSVSLPGPTDIASHFTGKKHLKAVANVDLRLKQEGRAVYVTKLGTASLPDIAAFFASFGEVTNLGVGKDKKNPDILHHVIVEFASEGSVGKVLRESRQRGGLQLPSQAHGWQKIQVFERKFKERRRSPSPDPCPSLDTDVVKMRLSIIHNPEEQLEELVQQTYLSEEEVNQRVEICRHLQKVFVESGFPFCQVHPFGSSVNSLGFPGCDLDIYLDLGPEHVNLQNGAGRGNPVSELTDSQEPELQQQELSSQQQEPISQQQKVRTAAKILRDVPACSRVHPILQARVPIVKFTHRMTGIQCDISFKNRYFAKIYGLAGGGGGGKLSSYALTLLGITFLQVTNPPLLHSVASLQEMPDLPPDHVDGWNCAFADEKSPSLQKLPANPLSTLQLLAEFFKWAASLDFETVVLCPLLGRVIPRDEAFVQSNFPPCTSFMGPEGLTTEKPMCLQDPFELTHNVCRNLPEKGVRVSKSHFKAASQVLGQLMPEEAKQEGLIGGINALFGMKVEEEKGECFDRSLETVLMGETEIVQKIFGNPNARPARLPGGGSDLEELVTIVLQNCLLLRDKAFPHVDCNGSLKRGLLTEESVKKRKKQDETLKSEKTVEHVEEDLVMGVIIGAGPGDAVEEEVDLDIAKVKSGSDSRYKQVGGQWVVDGLVWAGRKKKAAMVAEEDTAAREAAITKLVMEEQVIMSEPEVVFTCHVLTTASQSETKSTGQCWVALQKVHARKKSFESMVGWFNPYLTDLVARLAKERSSRDDPKTD